MSIRSISTEMWEDDKFESMPISTRYLWAYLLTCPSSKASGIYRIKKETIIRETMLTIEEVEKALTELTDKHMAFYSNSTHEIAIINAYRYNIRNYGKPVLDMLKKELSIVKNKALISIIIKAIDEYIELISDEQKYKLIITIREVYYQYSVSYKTNTNTNTNIKTNTNTNININNDSWTTRENDNVSWDDLLKELEN